MSIILVKLAAAQGADLSFPTMAPYNQFPGATGAELGPIPVETAKDGIGYIQLYIDKGFIEFKNTLEPWEEAALGLAPESGALASAEQDSLIVYIQPPAVNAGQPDYEYWYAIGAVSGDPALKITYSYTDPLFPTKVTGIKTEYTTLP